jgi:hypothetical protein
MKASVLALKDLMEDLWIIRFKGELNDEDIRELFNAANEILIILNERQLSDMVNYVRFLRETVEKKVWKTEDSNGS